jgi:hypothetical protein
MMVASEGSNMSLNNTKYKSLIKIIHITAHKLNQKQSRAINRYHNYIYVQYHSILEVYIGHSGI